MKKLIVNYTSREKRFAFLNRDQVEKIVIDRPEHQSLVSNIYYGTVTKVLPGMNAVFVDIGEEKNAYLHRNLLAKFVLSNEANKMKETTSVSKFAHQGEKLIVQVNKDATGTKGARLTGIIEIPGNHLIYMPYGRYVAVSKKIVEEDQQASLRLLGTQMKEEEEGVIFRTSSISASEGDLKEEFIQLRKQFKEMIRKTNALNKPGLIFQNDTFVEMVIDTIGKMTNGEVIVDDLSLKQKLEVLDKGHIKLTFYQQKENIFSSFKVEHEVEKALKRLVWLENGSYLIFDETEALTIIDVNTGKFSGKFNLEDTVLKTNVHAAVEIARQIRLRDIGGMVLIDFIDMKRDQDRSVILDTIEKELKKDEKRTKVIGFTPLGILQLTRKKTKVTLSEALKVKCPVCEGSGRIDRPETIAFRLERELFEHRHSENEAVLVETTNEVKSAFEGPGGSYLSHFEDITHLKLFFKVVENSIPYYLLKQFGDEQEISQKMHDLY